MVLDSHGSFHDYKRKTLQMLKRYTHLKAESGEADGVRRRIKEEGLRKMKQNQSNELNMIGALSEKYSGHPVLQSLLSLIPGWTAADNMLLWRANEIKMERINVFFEEIANGHCELTRDLIDNNDFLHSYFCAVRAASNCRNAEKIKQFARLFLSPHIPDLQVTPDEQEDLLSILEQTTVREFAALNNLYQHECLNRRSAHENELQHTMKYWGRFKADIISTIGIPGGSFNSFMARLERTGLYIRFTGTYLDYSGDIGRTTTVFSRLLDVVKAHNDDAN